MVTYLWNIFDVKYINNYKKLTIYIDIHYSSCNTKTIYILLNNSFPQNNSNISIDNNIIEL